MSNLINTLTHRDLYAAIRAELKSPERLSVYGDVVALDYRADVVETVLKRRFPILSEKIDDLVVHAKMASEDHVGVPARYHIKLHTLCVVYNVINLFGLHYDIPLASLDSWRVTEGKEDGDPFAQRDRFDVEIFDDVLLAAFFHDDEHSCGGYDDDVNISLATASLIKATSGFMIKTRVKRCVQLIRGTRFPHQEIVIDDPDQYLQYVLLLRDADTMTMFHRDWFEQIYGGLYAEMNYGKALPVGVNSEVENFYLFCIRQINFPIAYGRFVSKAGMMLADIPGVTDGLKLRAWQVVNILTNIIADNAGK